MMWSLELAFGWNLVIYCTSITAMSLLPRIINFCFHSQELVISDHGAGVIPRWDVW